MQGIHIRSMKMHNNIGYCVNCYFTSTGSLQVHLQYVYVATATGSLGLFFQRQSTLSPKSVHLGSGDIGVLWISNEVLSGMRG